MSCLLLAGWLGARGGLQKTAGGHCSSWVLRALAGPPQLSPPAPGCGRASPTPGLHPPQPTAPPAPTLAPRSPPQWETCFNRTLIVGTASTLLSGEWDEELTPVGASVRCVLLCACHSCVTPTLLNLAAGGCGACLSGCRDFWADTAPPASGPALARSSPTGLRPSCHPRRRCSYNADDEEEKQREQQLQRAAAAPAFAAAPAPAAAKAVPARALSPGLKSEVKLPAAAEAVVGGLIEQAESAAAAVAQLVAEELVGATKKVRWAGCRPGWCVQAGGVIE